MSHNPKDPRVTKADRVTARIIIAIAVAIIAFVLIAPARPVFPPRVDHQICLDVSRDESGQVCVQRPDVGGADPPRPPPGVTRYIMSVYSKGGAKFYFSEYRVSFWRTIGGLDSSGAYLERTNGGFVTNDQERAEMARFVEEQIIPNSEPMRIWPEVKGRLSTDGHLSWGMMQTRVHYLKGSLYCAACIGIGAIFAMIFVSPPMLNLRRLFRKRSSRPQFPGPVG